VSLGEQAAHRKGTKRKRPPGEDRRALLAAKGLGRKPASQRKRGLVTRALADDGLDIGAVDADAPLLNLFSEEFYRHR